MGWKDTIKASDVVGSQSNSSWRDTIERPKTWGETAVSTVAETLPMAGGIVGGVVGSGAGPAGSMLGAGGGYAAGDLVREKILQAMGVKIPSSGAGDILENVGQGAAFEGGGQLALRGVKALGNAVSGISMSKGLDLAERIPGATGKAVKYGRILAKQADDAVSKPPQQKAIDDFIKGTSPPPAKSKWDFPVRKK